MRYKLIGISNWMAREKDGIGLAIRKKLAYIHVTLDWHLLFTVMRQYLREVKWWLASLIKHARITEYLSYIYRYVKGNIEEITKDDNE